MTGKEIIRRVLENDAPPRIGLDLKDNSDFKYVVAAGFIPPAHLPTELFRWGRHPQLLEKVPDFRGEVLTDVFGDIYGRLNGITKGECIRGALDDWERLKDFKMPELSDAHFEKVKDILKGCDKFAVGYLPISVFSTLRDLRLMENALIDTLTEEDNVKEFLRIITGCMDVICQRIAGSGVDAVMLNDDWGTQNGTFINEQSFVELFIPAYESLCNSAHSRGMKVFMHSCGKNHTFIPHLIAAGIDLLQFDQPNIYPAKWLADNFAPKTTFFCPVDTQKVMPTGDRALIEKSALELVNVFKNRGGGFIAKDYTSWCDILVDEEWAEWARTVFVQNA